MFLMNKRHQLKEIMLTHARFVLHVAILSSVASYLHIRPARSEGLCEGLRLAQRSAEQRFVALRGSFDFDLSEYNAKITFGNATECKSPLHNL